MTNGKHPAKAATRKKPPSKAKAPAKKPAARTMTKGVK